MGIYIKGMRMPETCGDCHCGYYDGNKNIAWCKLQSERNDAVEGGLMWKQVKWNNVDKDCPLVEVPEPHGRLIDAKVALEEIDMEDGGPCYVAEQGLANTPTVIEAEGE